MATFLGTGRLQQEIEALITSARGRVVLLSPVLQVSARLRNLLEEKARMAVPVQLAFCESTLNPEQSQWLGKLGNIRLHWCRALHAKCYLSEDRCVVTSLNLHKFGVNSKDEMGVLALRQNDREMFSAAHDEAARVIGGGQEIRLAVEVVQTAQA